MAIAKFVAALLLALIALSMLQTTVMASHGHGGHHYDNTNVLGPRNSNQCPTTCATRCGSYPQQSCLGSCKKCCERCKCVYDYNGALCACYNYWKIRGACP